MFKVWRRKAALKKELRQDLYLLYVRDSLLDYEEGEDFEIVYARIEGYYTELGFSKEEIKKVDNSIAVISVPC